MARTMRHFLILMAALMLAACGSDEKQAPAADGLTKVSLVLNWFPEAEHGGFYAALHEGYYREAGLDVTIVPGGVNVPVVALVTQGKNEFGVVNADRVILGRAEGADVVALAAPIQTSPRCILVHEESDIKSFEELTELKLAVNSNDAFSMYLQKKYPLKGVQLVPYTGNVATFLTTKNMAQQGYNISEPFAAEAQGVKTRVLMLADAGYNPYTSLIIAKSDYIRANPDVAKRFVEASLKGWAKYVESPDATNAEITKLNPQMNAEILRFGAKELGPMVAVAGTPIGTMTADRWKFLVATLEDLALLETGKVRAEDCFVGTFLPRTGS